MRALKILVVAMGVLIVLGTVTLVALIVQRAGTRGADVAAQAVLDLPAGAEIVAVAGAGERFAVLVREGTAQRVVFVDAATGRVVGDMRPGAVPVR